MFEIWSAHLPALQTFLAICTQWRVAIGMSGMVTVGLDYASAEAGLRLSGDVPPPSVWSDLRLIESGALEALNEDRK
ncbi:DUF1799 domain-containing protein [Oceanicola sp. S124]|uniref:DUF1799 domain-containing protein n=1 Tax=Oceanicola sp. S124 TaxID=1042378 RepID=UPI002351DC16|nr:DUF1799 domain-containing protein [Oceanicola sp. S124]